MLCCVCLAGIEDEGIDIFGEMGRKLSIAKIIQQHLWIKPQSHDESLSHVCHSCSKTLVDFHEFYQLAERAHMEHQLLKKTLIIKDEIGHSSSCIKLETYEATYHDDIVQMEELQVAPDVQHAENLKNESVSKYSSIIDQTNEELERDIESCLENNLDTLELKKQVNPLDDTDFQDDDFGLDYMSDDYEPSENSDGQTLCSEDEDDNVKTTTSIENDDGKRKRAKKRNSSKETRKEAVPKKKRNSFYNKLDQKHTEAMILKHIPMGCCLCVYVGKTFADIVEHFREGHPKIKPYIMCCDKKLTKRFFVAQHALKHEDPNCFNCLECNKSFTTTCGLRAHNLNYHAPEEERIYSCELCPKKFARPNLLELHKPSHIPKDQWQFFCTKCPIRKSFASEYLLNVHTSMRHKRAKNVCHVCAKEIRDKYSFEKHVRLHFEDSGPRLPCPYPDCESWLKDEDNLKQHLKRHNPEGITYKCAECDKVCKNRRALTNHKRYTHSNETFSCEQCDKSFKKAISLREHMTQHTGETLYKCPFCPRTFNSNANMHAHKKRQHPIEWDEWRRNKKGSAQVLITKSISLQR